MNEPEAKPTHLNPDKVDQMPRNFFGIVYLDVLAAPVFETGHHDKASFEKQREAADKKYAGKWSFAVVKTRDVKDQWKCAIIFPDGVIKVLTQGQIASTVPKSRGRWLNFNDMLKIVDTAKWPGSVRFAMDTRVPWKTSAISLRIQPFDTEEDVIKWLKEIDPVRNILFVANPAATNMPPDEEKLYVLAITADA